MLEKWKAEKERLEVFLAGRIPEIDLEQKNHGRQPTDGPPLQFRGRNPC